MEYIGLTVDEIIALAHLFSQIKFLDSPLSFHLCLEVVFPSLAVNTPFACVGVGESAKVKHTHVAYILLPHLGLPVGAPCCVSVLCLILMGKKAFND